MALFTRLIVTLFGMAIAVLVSAVVLVWLTLYVAFASLRWLATGQKPQVVMMWQQVKTLRKGMGNGMRKVDVVEDVVVRDVHAQRQLPKD